MAHTKILTSAKECNINKLCDEIELSTGIKLKANTPEDTVDGFINQIISSDGTSILEIFTYDNDETANSNHKSTLRKKIPIDSEKTNIQAVITAHIK